MQLRKIQIGLFFRTEIQYPLKLTRNKDVPTAVGMGSDYGYLNNKPSMVENFIEINGHVRY